MLQVKKKAGMSGRMPPPSSSKWKCDFFHIWRLQLRRRRDSSTFEVTVPHKKEEEDVAFNCHGSLGTLKKLAMECVPTKFWPTSSDKDGFICVVLPMPWSENTWDSQEEIMMKSGWYLSCLETIQDYYGKETKKCVIRFTFWTDLSFFIPSKKCK